MPMRFRKHNLFVGTNLSKVSGDPKNVAMRFTPKKFFRKGEKIYAVYRKIPFTKRTKSEHTKLKSGKFIWTTSTGAEIGVYETKSTTLSTHTSFFDTTKKKPGKYYVEYISNDDTSVHEKVPFIIYIDPPEILAIRNEITEKILETVTKSPTSISDLKKICGV